MFVHTITFNKKFDQIEAAFCLISLLELTSSKRRCLFIPASFSFYTFDFRFPETIIPILISIILSSHEHRMCFFYTSSFYD